MKIAIPNYGCGNLMSVVRMVEAVGGKAQIVSDPSEIDSADKVILAGVGAFDHGVQCLNSQNWVTALNRAALEKRVPVLGICLGMQLMAHSSEEGKMRGLGWIAARVQKFRFHDSKLKVPHMGWNTVETVRKNALLAVDELPRFYFVHSYHLVCEDPNDVVGRTSYGYAFDSVIQRNNLFGVQFHPEKSHRFGMALMNRFVNEVGERNFSVSTSEARV